MAAILSRPQCVNLGTARICYTLSSDIFDALRPGKMYWKALIFVDTFVEIMSEFMVSLVLARPSAGTAVTMSRAPIQYKDVVLLV